MTEAPLPWLERHWTAARVLAAGVLACCLMLVSLLPHHDVHVDDRGRFSRQPTSAPAAAGAEVADRVAALARDASRLGWDVAQLVADAEAALAASLAARPAGGDGAAAAGTPGGPRQPEGGAVQSGR